MSGVGNVYLFTYLFTYLLNYLLTYLLLTHSLHGAESFLWCQLVLSYSRNSLHFVEPEGSFLHSQVPTNLSLFWTTSFHSMPLHFTSWRSILILLSPLCLGLPSGLFPSGFSTKTLYTPLLSPIHATCPTHLKWVQAWRDTGIGGSIILKLCWSQGMWRCEIDSFGTVATLQIPYWQGMSWWVAEWLHSFLKKYLFCQDSLIILAVDMCWMYVFLLAARAYIWYIFRLGDETEWSWVSGCKKSNVKVSMFVVSWNQ